MVVELVILFQGQAFLTTLLLSTFSSYLYAFHSRLLLEYPVYSDFLTEQVDEIEAFTTAAKGQNLLSWPSDEHFLLTDCV